MMMQRRALFIDRDGTLVQPRHYPSHPEDLIVFAGVGAELAALSQVGYQIVLITNQSGIAHGYFTEADLARMHAHLADLLVAEGVRLAGIYYCPHHPDGVVAPFARCCDCRKPQPGMLLRAAADRDIDLARSWFVGDILDDIEAGNRAGCHTILVDAGTEALPTTPLRQPAYVAHDTVHALRIIRALAGDPVLAALDYQPPSWEAMTADPLV